MSKKIAEGSSFVVLDVKAGSGAFMRTVEDATTLAHTLVELGRAHGRPTRALVSDMSTPLGFTAGNAIEVAEAIEVLAGGGPSDVIELTLTLAQEMLTAAGLDGSDPEQTLHDGRAMDVWRAMITAQGGDASAPLPNARNVHTVAASDDGVLTHLDAEHIGLAAWRLGAGRSRKHDAVSPAAGVRWHARPGDRVRAGQPLLELHSDDPARIEPALAALEGCARIGPTHTATPLLLSRVGAELIDCADHTESTTNNRARSCS